jgi:hypothetical protein
MHTLAMPGPDGTPGAMGGNSGGGSLDDPARVEIAYGPGSWRSPVQSGVDAIAGRNR